MFMNSFLEDNWGKLPTGLIKKTQKLFNWNSLYIDRIGTVYINSNIKKLDLSCLHGLLVRVPISRIFTQAPYSTVPLNTKDHIHTLWKLI